MVIFSLLLATWAGPVATYNNARFGYSVCFPTVMRANREADNGDGRTFAGPQGAKMAVWAGYDIDGRTLLKHMQAYSTHSDVVTYAASRKDWLVQSGRRGSYIFWRKAFKRDDRFVTLEIIYPSNAQGTYGSVVSRISSCFKA